MPIGELLELVRAAFRTDRYQIASARPVEEIVERARRAGATGMRSYSTLAAGPVSGRASPSQLVLTRHGMTRNSWRPLLLAHLSPWGTGSLVDFEIRLNAGVIVFSIVWMAFTIPLGLIVAAGALVEAEPVGLVGLLFPVFLVALTTLGVWLARDDRQFLRRVIEDITGVPPTSSGS